MKPTLLIIPGWGGTRETWRDFIVLAKENFEVICVELPCFGAEPPPSSVWGVEEYTQFVKSKIPPSKKVIILGHSFGGQVAVSLVGANPGICDTLILSGPAIFRKKWSLKRLVFWPIAKVGKLLFSVPGLGQLQTLARSVLYKAIDSPDYTQTSGRTREIFQKITTQDVSGFLPRITIPTLIVAGECDTYVSARSSARAAALIPHARFIEVSGGIHGLHRQDPTNFLEIIKNYLASTHDSSP